MFDYPSESFINPITGLAKFRNPIVEIKLLFKTNEFDVINVEDVQLLYCSWESGCKFVEMHKGWDESTLLKWRVNKLCSIPWYITDNASSVRVSNVSSVAYSVWILIHTSSYQ